MDRRKKSRENREQLRCCNWIRLPIGPIVVQVCRLRLFVGDAPKAFGAAIESGEGGKKVRCRTGIISQEPEYLSGPPHSFRECGAEKLLRKKKNESWAMRCPETIRGLTSPTL